MILLVFDKVLLLQSAYFTTLLIFAHFLDSFFCSFVLWVFSCFSCSSWLCKCFGWCCCCLLSCYSSSSFSSSSWFLKQGLTSLVPFFHLSLLRDCLRKKWEFSSFCLQTIASCLAWFRLLLDPLRKRSRRSSSCASLCVVLFWKLLLDLQKIPSSSSGASLCGVFLSFFVRFPKTPSIVQVVHLSLVVVVVGFWRTPSSSSDASLCEHVLSFLLDFREHK
jgi:hypothetical protein